MSPDDKALRVRLIRLAHANPQLRARILPMVTGDRMAFLGSSPVKNLRGDLDKKVLAPVRSAMKVLDDLADQAKKLKRDGDAKKLSAALDKIRKVEHDVAEIYYDLADE